MTKLSEKFLAFDDRLASVGVLPLTKWWRERITEWLDAYEQRSVLELWGCVGRGASKSTALYKLALFFCLFGSFAVPAGERHYAVVLSLLKIEAEKGLSIIAGWLERLGIRHRPSGDVIDIDDPDAPPGRGIRVVAASVGGVSGWRAFFVAKDERSKWPMSGVEEQDAVEIDVSAMSMTATHEFAPSIAFGSAWGAFGEFFDVITAGTTEQRMVLGPTPTYVAAPHVSIASLRRKYKDPKKYAREVECVFQAGASSALEPDQCRAALRHLEEGAVACSGVGMANDWSSGRANATAWLCYQWIQYPERWVDEGHWETSDSGGRYFVPDMHPGGGHVRKKVPASRRKLHIFAIGTAERWADRGETSDMIVAEIAQVAHAEGAQRIIADEYNAVLLASAFARHQLPYHAQHWDSTTKGDALAVLRQWLSDGDLTIEPGPGGEKLVEELIRLQEIIRPTGSVGIGARQGNDDLACCVLNLGMAQALLDLPGSPIGGGKGMVVYKPDGRVEYYGGAEPPR